MRLALIAAAILLFAATAAPVAGTGVLPNGTYRYQMNIGGKPVGSSTIVVSRSGSEIEIGESAALLGQGLVSRRTLIAASFQTLSYGADARGKHFAVNLAGSRATLTVAGQSTKITAPAGAPFVVNDNMAAGFSLIPATLHVARAKGVTLACLCGGFVAVPAPVVQNSETPARPQDVPARDASIAVSLQGMTATLWYDPETFVLQEFDLPSQALALKLASYDPAITTLAKPATPTPLPLPPAHYTSRDVAIKTDDGVTLRGTLTIPDDGQRPFSGFVLVHGSGCNDRDETIGPNKVFAQLANALSNDGYAVLRYDKRACGKSGGKFPLRQRLIADALDVIGFLRKQPGVDARRIYVLGHSEGGELAPSIAIADKHLRGIVLMAPPALPLEKILMQQALHYATPANRAEVAKKEQAEIHAIASGKTKGPGAAWLRSSFGVDPAKLIAKVPCPILILQGTKDFQVLPSDTPLLVNAAKAAHRDVTVVMLQDDDHLFIKIPADEDSSIGEYFTPSYLDPALFAAIESWLKTD